MSRFFLGLVELSHFGQPRSLIAPHSTGLTDVKVEALLQSQCSFLPCVHLQEPINVVRTGGYDPVNPQFGRS